MHLLAWSLFVEEGIPPGRRPLLRTCHLPVADQGQLRDFVRASEPWVYERLPRWNKDANSPQA